MEKKSKASSAHICPHCGKILPPKVVNRYYFRGKDSTSTCPHCQQLIKLEKEPLPIYITCLFCCLTFLAIQFYLYYIGSNSFHAFLFGWLSLFPFVVLFIRYRLQHIRFIKG